MSGLILRSTSTMKITEEKSGTDLIAKRRWKCTDCDYSTFHLQALKIHIKGKHKKIKDYKCSVCSYATNVKCNLKYHNDRVHLNLKNYICDQCPFSTSTGYQLKGHKNRVHCDNLYIFHCEKCNFKTSNQECGRKHSSLPHSIKCSECDFRTTSQNLLRRHKKSNHENKKEKRHYTHHTDEKTGQKRYHCPNCEFTAPIPSRVADHFARRHQKSQLCSMCNYETQDLIDLNQHIEKSHKSGENFKCSQCDRETKKASGIRRHFKVHHTNEKKYCPQCDFSAPLQEMINKHIRKAHTKKKFTCKICEYGTNQNDVLDKHIQTIHKTLRTCILCKFETQDKYELEKHMESVHMEKEYHCQVCQEIFKSEKDFIEHIKAAHKSEMNNKSTVPEKSAIKEQDDNTIKMETEDHENLEPEIIVDVIIVKNVNKEQEVEDSESTDNEMKDILLKKDIKTDEIKNIKEELEKLMEIDELTSDSSGEIKNIKKENVEESKRMEYPKGLTNIKKENVDICLLCKQKGETISFSDQQNLINHIEFIHALTFDIYLNLTKSLH